MEVENIKQKKLIFFLLIGVLLVLAINKIIWTHSVKRDGIYSKGIVIKSDAHKGGITITVQYNYNNRRYKSSVGSDLGKSAIGRQYFIQFKSEDPDDIVFHKDKPVPACLTYVEAPKEGWKEIPACP